MTKVVNIRVFALHNSEGEGILSYYWSKYTGLNEVFKDVDQNIETLFRKRDLST